MRSKSGLDHFLNQHGISTSELSRLSGKSRKHVITIRHGRGNPTHSTMNEIARACSRKLGRRVSIAEAFGLAAERRAS